MVLVSNGTNPNGLNSDPSEFLIWTFDQSSKLHAKMFMVEAINSVGEFLVIDVSGFSIAYKMAVEHINS